jgi:septal ring factor EnvC (AmiA/AmiB activator)
VNELDRLRLPHDECIERRLAEANARLAATEETSRQLQAADNGNGDEIARLNQELQGRGTQDSQLQADLSKLQAELSERIHDGDRLRHQIDSIHASICWRLTWPIRWLHKLVMRVRSAVSS